MTLQDKRSHEPSAFLSLLQQIQMKLAENQKVGIAVGSFHLIHAGTIHFLRRVRSECDCVVAAALMEETDGDAAAAKQLLRPEERVRVIRALREVDAAEILDVAAIPARWPEAAQKAVWYYSAAEKDLDPLLLGRIQDAGARVVAVEETGFCTTRSIIERMAQGKTH